MIDIDNLLNDAGIEFTKKDFTANGNTDAHTKYFIDPCLFDAGHTGKQAIAIIQYETGAVAYKCFHNSCKNKEWRDCIKYFQDKGVDTGKYTNAPYKKNNENENKNNENTFSLHKLCDIEFKPQNWLLKNIIPLDSLNQIFGDPGSMKSFLAIDIAACIATGNDFHGIIVKKQAPVIFIAGEGQNTLKMRFMAWSIKNKISLENAPIYISKVSASFDDGESIKSVIDEVDKQTKECGTPALIVIDTVARNESDWIDACYDAGIAQSSFSKLKQSLFLLKKIKIENGYVFTNR